MKVAFARPGHVLQPKVRLVALVVPMIVFINSMSCLAAESPEVPEHAYITYGDSWMCERGFKRADDECQSIKVPEHAFLTDSSWGDGWKCERGFKREGNRCSPNEG